MILSSSIIFSENTVFDQFLIQINDILTNRYGINYYVYSDEEYDQWAIDYVIECIQEDKTAEEIAEGIFNQWDPTDLV